MQTHDWSWATGLFEGEGSVSHHFTQRSSQVVVSLAMKDLDVVETLRDVVGVGSINRTEQRGSVMWHWRVTSIPEVIFVLQNMWPMLHDRRKTKVREVFDAYKNVDIKRKHQDLLDKTVFVL